VRQGLIFKAVQWLCTVLVFTYSIFKVRRPSKLFNWLDYAFILPGFFQLRKSY